MDEISEKLNEYCLRYNNLTEKHASGKGLHSFLNYSSVNSVSKKTKEQGQDTSLRYQKITPSPQAATKPESDRCEASQSVTHLPLRTPDSRLQPSVAKSQDFAHAEQHHSLTHKYVNSSEIE